MFRFTDSTGAGFGGGLDCKATTDSKDLTTQSPKTLTGTIANTAMNLIFFTGEYLVCNHFSFPKGVKR